MTQNKPDYSVIIPAFNEEELLPKTLDSLKQAMLLQTLEGEIVVVNNNCTDATANIASAHGCLVVFEPVNQISRARNTGAKASRGRFLVFLDADTCITGELLAAALRNLDSGRCAGGGALVALDVDLKPAFQFFLSFWNRLAIWRGLAAGCFIYCLREAFDAVGGFSEKVYASEEIWFSRAVRKWASKRGQSFTIIKDMRITSSGRKAIWYSQSSFYFLMLMGALFPFFVRFRWLCTPWYRRPKKRHR